MGQVSSFDALISAYYRKNIAQIRRKLRLRYPNLGQANVDDAIQQGFAKLIDRHRRETLAVETEADLAPLVFVTITNLLIDRWRAIARSNPEQETSRDANIRTGVWNPDHEPPKSPKTRRPRRHVALPETDIEISPTDEMDFNDMLAAVMSGLSLRNREVLEMLTRGNTPAEIGERFGLDGHVLVRVARQRFVAGLETVHAAGNEDAGRLKQLIARGKPARRMTVAVS
jgi:RNA polymerase sigma factor (sigma-70 family)